MSAAPLPSGLTVEEYFALPDEPRYRHVELIDGRLVPKFPPLDEGDVNPPTWLHQNVVGAVYVLIWNWIRAGSGRGSVTMEPPVQIVGLRTYLPDLAWYREGRSRPVGANPYLAGPPDLAVEVLSPSTRAFDLIRKRADYARVGVGELWLVDPDGPTALVLRRPAEPGEPAEFVLVEELDAGGALSSPLLPGLSIPVTDLA